MAHNYIGNSADSSSARALLRSVIEQLLEASGRDTAAVPYDLPQLVVELPRRLSQLAQPSAPIVQAITEQAITT